MLVGRRLQLLNDIRFSGKTCDHGGTLSLDAHDFVMEIKEHVFVFLPIIALALSITLYVLNKDTFLSDVNFRRALATTAYLALFMVLLMFLMGAIISHTGQIGTEV